MITFDSLTLKAFTEENSDFFTGARIQKIQQPTRREFVFTIRNVCETRKFYVNINPQFHHLCFMSKENEERRLIEIPQKPPMFCMQLRKYLENSRIAKVNQPEYERILEFYIETYNELSEKIYLCLAIELMGKHSNVVLYSYDTNVIIGCAHNVGAEKSREREMAGTLPYVYPPKQHKVDILNYNGEVDYGTLNSDFYWFSKSFAAQVEGQSLKKLQDFVGLKNLSPVIVSDFSEFSLFSELFVDKIPQTSVNTMIDNYFTHHQEKDKFQVLKSNLISVTNARLKKIQNSYSKMHERLTKDEDAHKYRLWGDLIMANLYANKDFSKSIDVFDYENDKNIAIVLDETKTLKENANKFYRLYTKSKTQKERLSELIEALMADKLYLEQILYSIECANGVKSLLEVKSELLPSVDKGAKKQKAAIEPLELEIAGCRVFVGKNNKQNDYIVSKLAKDEDWWFHTKDCAGSHVLLKCENPSDEQIFECAKLAKENSSAAKSSKVGVIYTKRKHLKKPPAANLGYVTYKFEKEIII